MLHAHEGVGENPNLIGLAVPCQCQSPAEQWGQCSLSKTRSCGSLISRLSCLPSPSRSCLGVLKCQLRPGPNPEGQVFCATGRVNIKCQCRCGSLWEVHECLALGKCMIRKRPWTWSQVWAVLPSKSIEGMDNHPWIPRYQGSRLPCCLKEDIVIESVFSSPPPPGFSTGILRLTA